MIKLEKNKSITFSRIDATTGCDILVTSVANLFDDDMEIEEEKLPSANLYSFKVKSCFIQIFANKYEIKEIG